MQFEIDKKLNDWHMESSMASNQSDYNAFNFLGFPTKKNSNIAVIIIIIIIVD